MKRFARCFTAEDGAIMPMVVMLFLTMIVMAGMGVDFMRHEAARADLQNALDRGVLAATAQTQTLAQREDGMTDAEFAAAKEELIRSYMRARTFSLAEPDLEVTIPDDLEDYETAVGATASYDMDTFFLKIAGFNEMGVPANSYAEQRRLDIEVALVLDVSGSMLRTSAVPVDPENPDGEKKNLMDAMKGAVSDFLTGLLDDQEEGRTLVSVVPYSGNTSTNAFMAQHYGLQPVTNFLTTHNYSYCFDFNTDGSNADSTVLSNPDYSVVDIGRGIGYAQQQMQHFIDTSQSDANNRYGGIPPYGCPRPTNQIFPYVNDVDDLTTMIDNMDIEHATATYSGVKWGAALLDPSSRDLVSAIIDRGDDLTDSRATVALDEEYEGWPQSYEDTGVHKYLIIMSDGRNTFHRKIRDEAHYYTPTEGLTDEELAVEQAERLAEWDQGWRGDNSDDLNNSQTDVGSTEGDELNKMICDALKENAGGGNLTIFSIGYDLEDNAAGRTAVEILSYCATNPSSDFFNITGGDDPAAAFNAIRARLSLLKLAQARR